MASFFPNKSYRTKEQWLADGKPTKYYQKPNDYPNSSLYSLGAAYRLAEGTPAGTIPKEQLIAQMLRENRPNDFGLAPRKFDVKSEGDKRVLSYLEALYKKAGISPLTIPAGNNMVKEPTWRGADKTRNALQAMSMLAAGEGDFTKYNGGGDPRYTEAVQQQLEALNLNPQHKEQVFNAFDYGYNNPHYFTNAADPNQEMPTKQTPSLLDLFRR